MAAIMFGPQMINFHPPKLQMGGPEIFEALFGNLERIWRGKESSVQGTGWRVELFFILQRHLI